MSYTDRGELKFLIDYQTYGAILKYIGPFTERDSNVGKSGSYILCSLYYDTKNNKFYWEKVEGEKIRRKVRIRTYIESESGKALATMLEVKKKDDRNVYKNKVVVEFDDALTFMDTGNADCFKRRLSDSERATLDNIIYLKYKFGLEPKIMIKYEREPFFDRYVRSTRLTFDKNVSYRTVDLRTRGGGTCEFAIPPNLMVLEIKYRRMLPFWVADMIRRFSLRLVTVSKYCEAMNASLARPDF